MRAVLQALTDELRRLKASGVKTISVSSESVELLRQMAAFQTESGDAAKMASTESSTAVSEPRPVVRLSETEVREANLSPKAARRDSAPSATGTAQPFLPVPPSVELPPGDKAQRMAWLVDKVTKDPICCARVRPGKKVVVGVGNLDARIFFCGEAPGAEEEIQGEPFVGPAGQLLTKMIQAMGLKRSDVYIGNIMNWRPDLPTPPGEEQVGNRPPTPEELSYCLPYLKAQLEIVNPEVIVALGSTAAQGLFGLGSFKTLGEIRGRWKLFEQKPVMVTYHPSYILRTASNRSKRAIWEDLLQVMERIGLPISEKQRGFFLDK